MKKHSSTGLVAILFSLAAVAQVTPLYKNSGLVTDPQIDATIVINSGTIVANLPFTTQSTLFLTNQATALISGGSFRFDFLTNGFPFPSDSFVNFGTVSTEGNSMGAIRVSTTNLLNSGLLTAPATGLIRLEGERINLARGGLRTGQPSSANGGALSGRGYMTETNFSNGPGITDSMWNVDTNSIDLRSLASAFAGFQPFVYSNRPSGSVQLIQIVMVNTNALPANVAVQAGFVDPYLLNRSYVPCEALVQTDNPEAGRIAIVRFLMSVVDSVTSLPGTNVVSVLDYSAVLKTNLTLLTNVNSLFSYRPSSLEVIRATPYEWYYAVPPNASFTNTLVFSPDFPSEIVTNAITADYTALIASGNIPNNWNLWPLGGGVNLALYDPTNLPGRIEIIGRSLDMSLTRFRSEGLLTIKTDHLLGHTGVILDAPIVRLDLACTNGWLTVSNLVLNTVQRLSGTVRVASQVYSVPTTNSSSGGTGELRFHICAVTPSLQTAQSVDIYSLSLRGSNILVADNLNVGGTVTVETENLTVTGSFATSHDDFSCLMSTNLPHLKTVTNMGVINLGNVGYFGSEGTCRIQSLVNQGILEGKAILTRTEILDNSQGGRISATDGSIDIDTYVGRLENSQITSDGDVTIYARDFKMRNSLISAGASLNLTVTDRLTDGGPGSSNLWRCANGFKLNSVPPNGDLLGTWLVSTAAQFAEVRHVCGANNCGINRSGYSNNMAIGKLTLDGGPYTIFRFAGVGANKAMYVDFLELLNNATNYLETLRIEPSLVIYFAAANLPVEKLDGQFNGRLRWVRDFAGPNSSTQVRLPSGETVWVNKSLRESLWIDSDADGAMNGLDASPFDGVVLSLKVTNTPALQTLISWNAAQYAFYEVEYATNLVTPAWYWLMNYTNNVGTNRLVTITNSAPSLGGSRYYRVRYFP